MRKHNVSICRRDSYLRLTRLFFWFICLFTALEGATYPRNPEMLWSNDELIPWVVGVYDTKPLQPEERAQMLERLHFKKFAYFREPDNHNIKVVDAEIEALQRHHIQIVAWWFSYDADDPYCRELLEAFKKHHIHPALWVSPTFRDIQKSLRETLPERLSKHWPKIDFDTLPESDRATIYLAVDKARKDLIRDTFPVTQTEQQRRIQQEADRVRAIVELAAPYGNQVALYNHNGWSGIEDNQVAIIKRLSKIGMGNVGMVYAFNHVRDAAHDDTLDFPNVWSRIRRYVVAITITGICMDDGSTAYPSQGDGELAMLRTIQTSGWRGDVGVFAGEWHGRGDAESTLRNILVGVDWIAAELKHPGSGGPPPFPAIPLHSQPSE